MRDYRQSIKQYLKKEIGVMLELDVAAINAAINALMDAREREANIYVFGNGGSAATASHFVCDFAKGCYEKLGAPKMRFHCLSDNTPITTAIANDIGYEDIYLFQLKDILKQDDLIIAISGSGNSKNIVKAVEYAKEIGTKVIGLTGYSGGRLKELADYELHVPADDMQIAEDIHMVIDHMILKVIGNE